MAQQIAKFHSEPENEEEFYDFTPVLLAVGISGDVLEELPTLIGDMKVKLYVESSQLFLTDLSTGGAHAAGVSELQGQAWLWSKTSGFQVVSDCVHRHGDNASAPDVVIEARPTYRPPGTVGSARVGRVASFMFWSHIILHSTSLFHSHHRVGGFQSEHYTDA